AGNNLIAVTYNIVGCGGCPCPNSDWDQDGMSDSEELSVGSSNPLNPDSDGNGLPDGWEYQFFGAPTGNDPNADPDGDGQSNVAEYTSGTDPTNAASALRITDVARQPNGDVVVSVSAVTGKKYVLLASTNLTSFSAVS